MATALGTLATPTAARLPLPISIAAIAPKNHPFVRRRRGSVKAAATVSKPSKPSVGDYSQDYELVAASTASWQDVEFEEPGEMLLHRLEPQDTSSEEEGDSQGTARRPKQGAHRGDLLLVSDPRSPHHPRPA